jgi:carbonic anhydrase
MDRIIAGVHRFRRTEYAKNREMYEELARKQQKPMALFITCSDSRVLPHRITQTQPGDLFEIRNAGNIIPPHGAASGGESATIEYSIDVLAVKHIIVCGHSQCGAMKAMLQETPLEQLPAAKAWFANAEATKRIVRQKYAKGGYDLDSLGILAAQENVLVQMNHVSTHPCVAARLAAGDVQVYGWYYDIGGGLVLQYDQSLGRFVELGADACAASPMPVLTAETASSVA